MPKSKVRKINNMGAITKKEMEDFARLVLKDFPRWKMKWTTCGGVCIHKIKTICVDRRYIGVVVWEAKEHIIHEAAHIKTYPKDLHGKYFYKEYIRLLKKFMVKEDC